MQRIEVMEVTQVSAGTGSRTRCAGDEGVAAIAFPFLPTRPDVDQEHIVRARNDAGIGRRTEGIGRVGSCGPIRACQAWFRRRKIAPEVPANIAYGRPGFQSIRELATWAPPKSVGQALNGIALVSNEFRALSSGLDEGSPPVKRPPCPTI